MLNITEKEFPKNCKKYLDMAVNQPIQVIAEKCNLVIISEETYRFYKDFVAKCPKKQRNI